MSDICLNLKSFLRVFIIIFGTKGIKKKNPIYNHEYQIFLLLGSFSGDRLIKKIFRFQIKSINRLEKFRYNRIKLHF